MLLIFQILFLISSVLLLPWYLTKMIRRGNVSQGFGERLGFYPADVRQTAAGAGPLWIQACSVGEMRVALVLIAQLRKCRPELPIVLTTTTSTGREIARRNAPDGVRVLYYPVDFYPCVRRALRLLRPRMLLLVETDVWPTMILTAGHFGVPVGIVNGRMSKKSFRGYKRMRFFSRPVFRRFALVCSQGPLDGDRYRLLGTRADAVHVTGSLKFDEVQAPPAGVELARQYLDACGAGPSRPIWVCGSTYPGEEAIAFRILQELRRECPDLFLVLAPRHPERARRITAIARRFEMKLALRTESPRKGVDGVLLNTTGELKSFYNAATLIFVGKSLRGRGGQNLIEAAAAGAPVLFGPAMQNFEAVAAAFVRAGGAVQVQNERELCLRMRELLENPEDRTRISERAQRVIADNAGAAVKTGDYIFERLRTSSGSQYS